MDPEKESFGVSFAPKKKNQHVGEIAISNLVGLITGLIMTNRTSNVWG
jgi:hypothetical protein